jgi:hypothetical protein
MLMVEADMTAWNLIKGELLNYWRLFNVYTSAKKVS